MSLDLDKLEAEAKKEVEEELAIPEGYANYRSLEANQIILDLISELREKEKAIGQLIENYQSVRSDWVSELTKRTSQQERLASAEEALKFYNDQKMYRPKEFTPNNAPPFKETPINFYGWNVARAHFEKYEDKKQ